MKNLRNRIVALVDKAVKDTDKEVMILRTFYDDASDRAFITLVKGRRKVNLTFSGRDAREQTENITSIIKTGIEKLSRVPIG